MCGAVVATTILCLKLDWHLLHIATAVVAAAASAVIVVVAVAPVVVAVGVVVVHYIQLPYVPMLPSLILLSLLIRIRRLGVRSTFARSNSSNSGIVHAWIAAVFQSFQGRGRKGILLGCGVRLMSD